MWRKDRWTVLAVVATLGLGVLASYALNWGDQASGIDPSDRDRLALGRQVYDDHCAACHGAGLEGQPDWRQRRSDGRLPAPPHDETGHTWHHPDAQLFALTKYGPAAIVGGNYQSDMPAYEGVLSDDEIWAVLSYIKSRWPAPIQARHDQINEAAK
ncbi:c-type cytochrome [Pelagibius sp.]|uniref:c-type cytochrome n=1 Tax=Pelagibius sp. TaxID=1931238 RepID=UPI003BAFD7F6